VENQDGSTSLANVIVTNSFLSVLTIKGCAIDAGFSGIWMAKVTKRISDVKFDRFKTTIPLHISVKVYRRAKRSKTFPKNKQRFSNSFAGRADFPDRSNYRSLEHGRSRSKWKLSESGFAGKFKSLS